MGVPYRSEFEAQLTIEGGLLECSNTAVSEILECEATCLIEIRQELVERALVCHGAGHPLSHANFRGVIKVALSASEFHGIDAAHSAISFQTETFFVKVLSRSFLSSSQHGAHHDSRSSECKGTDDVSNSLHTSICDHRNSKVSGIACN